MRNKLLYLVLPFFMLSCNEWLNVEPAGKCQTDERFGIDKGMVE